MVKQWQREHLSDPTRETLLSDLSEWKKACQLNEQFPSLCQAFLLQARISFASVQFEEVERLLEHCLETAEANQLSIYQEAAKKEKGILFQHKKRIEEEMARPITPEEQAQVIHEYVRVALESLEKERLI